MPSITSGQTLLNDSQDNVSGRISYAVPEDIYASARGYWGRKRMAPAVSNDFPIPDSTDLPIGGWDHDTFYWGPGIQGSDLFQSNHPADLLLRLDMDFYVTATPDTPVDLQFFFKHSPDAVTWYYYTPVACHWWVRAIEGRQHRLSIVFPGLIGTSNGYLALFAYQNSGVEQTLHIRRATFSAQLLGMPITMAGETVRTYADLLDLFEDNDTHDITALDLRDLIVTFYSGYASLGISEATMEDVPDNTWTPIPFDFEIVASDDVTTDPTTDHDITLSIQADYEVIFSACVKDLTGTGTEWELAITWEGAPIEPFCYHTQAEADGYYTVSTHLYQDSGPSPTAFGVAVRQQSGSARDLLVKTGSITVRRMR